MIIDDEPFVREDIKAMLSAHQEIRVVCEAGSIAAAQKLLKQTRPDVVFLDIQLRGGTGFDLVPFIDPAVHIIFITAHDTYAIRAFEVNALDYLLKPVHPDRLAESIRRLKDDAPAGAKNVSGQPAAFKPGDRVFVNTDRGRIFVALDKVAAVCSLGGNYTTLRMDNGEKIISRKTMKSWEALLPDPTFVRIHRATIINTGNIEQVLSDKTGSYFVHLAEQDDPFKVSRRMAPRLKHLVKKRSV